MTPGKSTLSGRDGQKKEREIGFCPFLGFEDDPETALAYPSPYNFCYKCKPIAPVNIAHQRKVCLTHEFNQCPVFLKETLESLPKEYRGARVFSRRKKTWIPIAVLILVILLGLFTISFLGLIRIPGMNLPVITRFATATQTMQVVLITKIPPTMTLEATATIQPTNTIVKTFPVRTTPRAIETPFGGNPKLVIHKLLEGEGYILLAERFGTTVEAIKAINFELPESLWVNTILVIPINTDDVTGLPQFSVREITTEGLTIEDFAQRMQLDADQLKKYNDLPDAYLLRMGELIIIPN